MRIGFTGTRHGMTEAQRIKVRLFIYNLAPESFDHGCCVGADEDAASIVHDMRVAAGVDFPRIIAHPPIHKSWLSDWALSVSQVRRTPKDYLPRNRDIVECCDLLIACPFESAERARGGTWYTVRYARRLGASLSIIWPNGDCGHVIDKRPERSPV